MLNICIYMYEYICADATRTDDAADPPAVFKNHTTHLQRNKRLLLLLLL